MPDDVRFRQRMPIEPAPSEDAPRDRKPGADQAPGDQPGDDKPHRDAPADHSGEAADRGWPLRTWLVLGLVVLMVLSAAGWFGWHWYSVGRFLIDTDDAYTQADNVVVSPQLSGYVSELGVTDNQPVHRGDVIARIDDRTYRAQRDQAQADVAAGQANVGNAVAQIELQHAVIAQAQAGLVSAQATLTFARQELARAGTLVRTGADTVQHLQQLQSGQGQQQAGVAQAEANLAAEQKRLELFETQRQQASAGLVKAQAALAAAEVNLGYTVITAPVDGVVGDRSLRLGQYVGPGTRLMTLVPMHDVYVVANYKETQLDRMHQGQAVSLTVDSYPDIVLHGHVDSLAPGTGAQFSLLPPENATGNFTKIVQRVPVKIVIEDGDPMKGRLRPGLSVEPVVDVRDTRGKPLEDRLPNPSAGPAVAAAQ